MPTQEERLAALEKNTAESIHELQASTTIMLGVMQSQGQDIKRILLRLDSMEGRQSVMDGRLNILDGRLNFLDTRLAKVEQTLDEHTMRFDRVETLLGQILARLPEPA